VHTSSKSSRGVTQRIDWDLHLDWDYPKVKSIFILSGLVYDTSAPSNLGSFHIHLMSRMSWSFIHNLRTELRWVSKQCSQSARHTELAARAACSTTPQHHPVWVRFTFTSSCTKLAVRVTHEVHTRCTTHTQALSTIDDH